MYETEIASIKADLGITDLPIEWRWVSKKWLKRTKSFTTWGTHTYFAGSHIIRIATQRPYADVVKTIAHELRHAWQRTSGVYRYEYLSKKGWCTFWSGTEYAPAHQPFRRKAYWQRPHEIDARAYEASCWDRLFSTGPAKAAYTTETTVADLFLGALY